MARPPPSFLRAREPQDSRAYRIEPRTGVEPCLAAPRYRAGQKMA
jgi:hypothetical protein